MKKNNLLLISIATGLSLKAQNVNDDYTTEFPNLHPLAVHFPLLLLMVAAVMQFVVVYRKIKIYNATVTAITVFGFISAALAVTNFHAHPAHNINPVAHKIFEGHERFAFFTLWLSGIGSIIKIAGTVWDKKWIEIAALFILLSSAVTVAVAGHYGSELVYKQGIGPKGEMLEEEDHH